MHISAATAEILIGMAGALTGPNAYQGEQQQQGVELAVADLNAAGGVLGQQMRLISVDDACDSQGLVRRRAPVLERLNSGRRDL
jgi:branched-chain amino acid transport system substrate-binding protein